MLSYHSGFYHLRTGTVGPKGMPGMSEMLLQADHRKLEEFLVMNRDTPVVLDKSMYLYGHRTTVAKHVRTLYTLYEPWGTSAQSDILVLRRRAALTSLPGPEGLLGPLSEDTFHGERRSAWPYFLTFLGEKPQEPFPFSQVILPPIKTGSTFTLEMLVKPGRGQADHATLISTHPGKNNFAGFVAHQEGDTESDYTFSYGNGHSWETPLPFTLEQEAWNHLMIVCETTGMRSYVNGRKAGAVHTTSPLKESDLELTLGDWLYQGRPFNGQIAAFAITPRPLSETAVASRWAEVRKRL